MRTAFLDPKNKRWAAGPMVPQLQETKEGEIEEDTAVDGRAMLREVCGVINTSAATASHALSCWDSTD